MPPIFGAGLQTRRIMDSMIDVDEFERRKTLYDHNGHSHSSFMSTPNMSENDSDFFSYASTPSRNSEDNDHSNDSFESNPADEDDAAAVLTGRRLLSLARK